MAAPEREEEQARGGPDAVGAQRPGRRELRRLEIYQRLLDVSEALFIEKGFDETPVAEICRAADVSYGTFFNYFPAKSDLLVAFGDRAIAETAEQLDRLTKMPVPIAESLGSLFAAFADQIESVSAGERALAGRVQSVAFTEVPSNRKGSFRKAFEIFLTKAREEGRVRSDIPVESLADVLAGAYGSMSLSWIHIEGFPVRQRAIALAEALGTMLAPHADASN